MLFALKRTVTNTRKYDKFNLEWKEQKSLTLTLMNPSDVIDHTSSVDCYNVTCTFYDENKLKICTSKGYKLGQLSVNLNLHIKGTTVTFQYEENHPEYSLLMNACYVEMHITHFVEASLPQSSISCNVPLKDMEFEFLQNIKYVDLVDDSHLKWGGNGWVESSPRSGNLTYHPSKQ
jgi:hypothetical protein